MQALEFADKLEIELLAFREKHSLITGTTAYVSTGAHDDTVMGLALAVSKVRQYSDYEDTIIPSNWKKTLNKRITLLKHETYEVLWNI